MGGAPAAPSPPRVSWPKSICKSRGLPRWRPRQGRVQGSVSKLGATLDDESRQGVPKEVPRRFPTWAGGVRRASRSCRESFQDLRTAPPKLRDTLKDAGTSTLQLSRNCPKTLQLAENSPEEAPGGPPNSPNQPPWETFRASFPEHTTSFRPCRGRERRHSGAVRPTCRAKWRDRPPTEKPSKKTLRTSSKDDP